MNKIEYEESLFKSLHYTSYSRLSTAFDCLRYFELYYIMQVRPEFDSPPLVKGGLLHEYYAVLNNTSATKDEKKSVVMEFTKKFPLEFMKYSTKWKKHAASLPQGPMIVLEKEMQMSVPISAPLVSTKGKKYNSIIVKGYIDYLNLNRPGTAYIIDYKSGKAAKSPKYADQLAIYAAMTFSAFPDVEVIKAYTYDISDNMNSEVSEKNSFEFERGRDFSYLMETLAKMLDTMVTMVHKRQFPPTPCIRCSYCPDYACRFNRVPEYRKGTTALETKTDEENPKKQTSVDPLDAPPLMEISSPEDIPLESVTAIGDKEKKLLMELKRKLEK